ncbi:MAG TPA: hypothetical protein RMG45_28810, partial [Polyangiaceae bacterium LLY-WYZ-15_(1-7)]|nr:hypothetical protein [Polyangiaceae bacterium LLY-WYZ-15_(1-7)]
MRLLLHALLLGSAALVPLHGAVAQDVPAPPTPEPTPASATVSYGRVDRATVRVFAIRGVNAIEVQGRRARRVVAVPEAGHGSGVLVDRRGVIATA